MKIAILMATALLAATGASAVEPDGRREKAFTLYFTQSFGDSSRQRTPLAFGLRLDQASPLAGVPAIALFDARLSLDGRRSLRGLGLEMFDSAREDRRWFASFGSSGGYDPIWVWSIAAGIVVATSCLTENWPCEDDNTSSSGPNYPGD